MTEKDVTLVNAKTNETPQVLASGQVDAIGAWQPIAGQAMKGLPGRKPLYTSAKAPGLIYDVLAVSPASLAAHKDDYIKLIKVWDRVVHYINDPKTQDDAVAIMAKRVGLTPAAYKPLLKGTHLIDVAEGKKTYQESRRAQIALRLVEDLGRLQRRQRRLQGAPGDRQLHQSVADTEARQIRPARPGSRHDEAGSGFRFCARSRRAPGFCSAHCRFVLPIVLWSIVSYVPAVWHPQDADHRSRLGRLSAGRDAHGQRRPSPMRRRRPAATTRSRRRACRPIRSTCRRRTRWRWRSTRRSPRRRRRRTDPGCIRACGTASRSSSGAS